MKKQNGITLVALVITIIVLLILAGVSISSLVGENGILSKARKSSTLQRLATYNEEFQMTKSGNDIKDYAEKFKENENEIYAIGEEVKKYIPNLRNDDVDRIVIFNGKLVYTGENLSNTDIEAAESLGYLNMSKEDYEYMLGMYYLEKAVKNHSNDAVKIGTPLGTGSNTYVTIAGINYGLGWYKIESAEELTRLDLTQEQQSLLLGKLYSTNGYIVKYSSGAVQSITGKNMYAGLNNEIWKYTFNYMGESNGIIINNLLSGVDSSSSKSPDKWGDLKPSYTYAASGITEGIIENYYKEPYEYGSEGEIILKENSNILNMPIDQSKKINQKYSLNITFKCDINNMQAYPANFPEMGGTLVGISDYANLFVSRVSIYKGLMRIFSFEYVSDNVLKQTTEYQSDGVFIFDISEYSNKYVNLQITAEANKKMKVYINGKLIKEMNAGHKDDLTYNYCTIGELRPGRGFKFLGKIYNFGLYGDILTDEEVAQNWNYIKNELGIDENGNKI